MSGHVLYRTMIVLLMQLAQMGFPVVGSPRASCWWRCSSGSARASCPPTAPACSRLQQPEMTLHTFMKLAGGGRDDETNLNEFLIQADQYRDGGDAADMVFKVLNLLGATHPFHVLRAAELRDWIEAGEYDRVLRGEYRHRTDGPAPYKDDLAAARRRTARMRRRSRASSPRRCATRGRSSRKDSGARRTPEPAGGLSPKFRAFACARYFEDRPLERAGHGRDAGHDGEHGGEYEAAACRRDRRWQTCPEGYRAARVVAELQRSPRDSDVHFDTFDHVRRQHAVHGLVLRQHQTVHVDRRYAATAVACKRDEVAHRSRHDVDARQFADQIRRPRRWPPIDLGSRDVAAEARLFRPLVERRQPAVAARLDDDGVHRYRSASHAQLHDDDLAAIQGYRDRVRNERNVQQTQDDLSRHRQAQRERARGVGDRRREPGTAPPRFDQRAGYRLPRPVVEHDTAHGLRRSRSGHEQRSGNEQSQDSRHDASG
jgi:hypothetical protein